MPMHYERWLSAIAALAPLICAAEPLEFTDIAVLQRVTPLTLQISVSGPAPTGSDLTDYTNKSNWQVFWRRDTASVPRSPDVASAEFDSTFHLLIHLQPANLPEVDPRQVVWTVLFKPPVTMAAVPTVITSAPPRTGNSSAANQPAAPFFKPPTAGAVPDILVTGSFLAGGNSKPIYTLQAKAGIYAPESWRILGWRPGITSELAANQSAQSSANRSRLDPDSLTAGLSWLKITERKFLGISGLSTQIDLPKGEFARYGPGSDIVAGFLTTIALKRPKPIGKRTFLKFYPVVGLEAGWNLNRPNTLMGSPIDLSHYSGIVRGVTGVDESFGVTTPDRSTTVFSLLASYRVRLPAENEPFAFISNGQTFAYNTDKARHSLSVNVTWSPWNSPYFGVTANYLWGSLPPIFSFVDHQVSIGLLVQANQRSKPAIGVQ